MHIVQNLHLTHVGLYNNDVILHTSIILQVPNQSIIQYARAFTFIIMTSCYYTISQFSNKAQREENIYIFRRHTNEMIIINGQNEIRSTVADLVDFATGDAGNLAVKSGKEPSSSARASSSKLSA